MRRYFYYFCRINLGLVILCITLSNIPIPNFFTKNQSNTIFPSDSLDELRKYYSNKGFDYYMTGDYDKAEESLLKALEIKKIIFSEFDERIANSHINLGIIYGNIWKFETALQHYDSAEIIYQYIDPNHINIAAIYINKAIIFRLLHDYGKAISYDNNAIRILTKKSDIDYDQLSTVYYNLGIVYEYIGEYKTAIENFNKSLFMDKSKSLLRLIKVYNSLALNYKNLNQNQLAKKYFLKCIDLVEKNFQKNDFYIADIYNNYGLFLYESDNNPEMGLAYYKKAFESFVSKFGYSFSGTLIALNNIGDFYLKRNLDSALYYIQTSLRYAYPGDVSDSITSNPDIDNLPFNPAVLSALKLKSQALILKYFSDKNIDALELSLTTYLTINKLIDKVRLRFESETSNYTISEKESETFSKGLDVAILLYKLSNNEKYAQIAFNINEKRKAFTLLTSIRKHDAKEFGGIPSNLRVKEVNLSRQISAYEELIYAEKKKNYPDINAINIWDGKLFNLNQEYEKLITRFESEFLDYYRLKYDASVITPIEIIRNLDYGTTVLNYAICDSSLYIFSINSDSFNTYNLDIDSNFINCINTMISTLSHPNFSADVKQAYADYTRAASYLYKKLIEPCRESIQGNSLIIIPDGLLSYLPFEALLTAEVDSDKIDYRQLPYLLRDYNISYSYSATLHFESHRHESNPSRNLLAFAPDYSNMLAQLTPEPSYLGTYRDQLIPLPGVKDEVGYITKIVKGDLYADDQATESNFKKNAGDYKILHLAMHTIVDNENPMYSKLAFTQNVDTAEDGFLNTYEIYNMKFNARMAVLSSCKTGFGKLQKGEGVMSLARGFMYAGCPSIIMTLWEVSDKSGALLMKNFYRHLEQGKFKSEALRQAKLDFIVRADQLKAHPYFWSSYVAIGDVSPIFENKRWHYLLIVSAGTLLLAATALFIWFRRKKKHSRQQPFREDEIFT